MIRCIRMQLNMILNESLRLYPPTIATIRRSRTDVELGGYKVPRGTELLIPILAVHHDQSIWGNDAKEFNPARFAEGVARAAKHPVAFIPFGLGVRTCIGQNLALLQAKLALAIILQRFSFRLAPTYQHAPTVLMLLYPQYGAPIIFQRLPQHDRDQDQGSWSITTIMHTIGLRVSVRMIRSGLTEIPFWPISLICLSVLPVSFSSCWVSLWDKYLKRKMLNSVNLELLTPITHDDHDHGVFFYQTKILTLAWHGR